MSIRVGQHSGIDSNLELAQKVGFAANLPASPVSYLGAFESSPLELTSAYAVLANLGKRRTPFLIDRIEDSRGRVLFETRPDEVAVMSPEAAWLTVEVLGQVMERGTGRGARSAGYEAPCYGKTGTTNNYRDAWFAGFTNRVTCGVWVGMDRPRTIMNRGYGSTLALPIWTEVLAEAEETEFKASAIEPPFQRRSVRLCSSCGLLESRRSVNPYSYAVPVALIPTKPCSGHFGANIASGNQEKPLRKIGRFLFRRRR